MPLYTLIYVSIATHPMTDEELRDLLAVARKKNASLNVTGMLLYRDGYFIQVLEGEQSTVTGLYNKIATDPRHKKVLVVYANEIQERVFDRWAMGFNPLNAESISHMEGFTDFLISDLNQNFMETNKNRAMLLLQSFRDKTYF